MYSWEDNYNNESVSFILTVLLCLYIASLKTIRLIPHGKDLGLPDSSCLLQYTMYIFLILAEGSNYFHT